MNVLNLGEAAEALRLPKRSLKRLIDRGDGPPHFHVGRNLRFDADALRAWLANGGTRQQ